MKPRKARQGARGNSTNQTRRKIPRKLPNMELEPGEKIRLSHVHDWDPGHIESGTISVASKVNFEDKTVKLGFSFCSPVDRYERREGVLRAIGRLRKFPIIINFSISPAQAMKAFVVDTFKQGELAAREAFAFVGDGKERKKALQTVIKFLITSMENNPAVIEAPLKALKHFPFKHPWWWGFTFPLDWQEASERETREVA